MRRHTRTAATAAIALSLLLAPRMALAEDEKVSPPALPTKPLVPTPNAAAPKPQLSEYEALAQDAYLHMTEAKKRCDPGAYSAHRTRLMGAIAAMRFFAKKSKKLKGFGAGDPVDLNQRADDLETLIDIWDRSPWPCPSKAKDDHAYLPNPGGTKADPPDWAIALAGQQASSIHDGFDGPGAGSFDGIAMVDRALRAARGGMGDRRQPCDDEPKGWSTEHRGDPRYPMGFAPAIPTMGRMPGFGGWGF